MKTFLVEVVIQTGEYQKKATKLIQASTQTEAESYALTGECHGTLGESAEWVDGGIADLGYEFHYSVKSCVEVAPEHVRVLSQYLALNYSWLPFGHQEPGVEIVNTRRVTWIAVESSTYEMDPTELKKIVEEAGSQEDAVTYLQEIISPTSHEVELIDVTMEHDSSFEVEALPV